MLKLFRQDNEQKFDHPIEVTRRIYAVGDIHGRNDLLGAMIDKILCDAGDCDEKPLIVFLGDYIDRGENSRDVIDSLIDLSGWPEFDTVLLMGNHERMLLDFLAEPAKNARWLRFGGLQTLLSYGAQIHGSVTQPGNLEQIRDELEKLMGGHKHFLEKMQLSHRNGNMFFCHAAADPLVAPRMQEERHLLWGHDDFFDRPRSDGVWVTHGHTVVEKPVIVNGRISIDTGAYFSNKLTSVRFAGTTVRFLTV